MSLSVSSRMQRFLFCWASIAVELLKGWDELVERVLGLAGAQSMVLLLAEMMGKAALGASLKLLVRVGN